MKLHTISVKKSVLREILDNGRDFIITEQNDVQIADLINIENTTLLFKVKDIIHDDGLKDNYCIIVIKELK